jgi:protein-S-isoprenylcysteine O-methyltransferase Ste14
VFAALTVLFTIFWFVNLFAIQQEHFHSYSASILNFLIMAYCIIYFYRLLIDLPTQQLQQLPLFWISTGFLVQGAGASFLYLFTDHLTKFFFDDMLIYWTANSLIGILHVVLIIIGVFIDLKNTIARRGDPDVPDKRSLPW